MESIPEEVRAKDINEWNLSADSLSERTLGVHWFILEDKLGFRMNIKNQPSTRRGILSVVSSVYDPIGFVSFYNKDISMHKRYTLFRDTCSKF